MDARESQVVYLRILYRGGPNRAEVPKRNGLVLGLCKSNILGATSVHLVGATFLFGFINLC